MGEVVCSAAEEGRNRKNRLPLSFCAGDGKTNLAMNRGADVKYGEDTRAELNFFKDLSGTHI